MIDPVFRITLLKCSYYFHRVRWFMESAIDVANFFRVKFHTNRTIRIAKSSSIFGIVSKWIHWYSFIRSTLALVIFRCFSIEMREIFFRPKR